MATSLRRLAAALNDDLRSRLSADSNLPWVEGDGGLVANVASETRAKLVLDFIAGPHARPVGTSWDYVAQFDPREFGYRFQAHLQLESTAVGATSARLFGGAGGYEAFAVRNSQLIHGRFLKASPLHQVLAADARVCYELVWPLVSEAWATLTREDSIWTAAESLLSTGEWQSNPFGRISLAVLARGPQAARSLVVAEIEELRNIGRRTGIPRNDALLRNALKALDECP